MLEIYYNFFFAWWKFDFKKKLGFFLIDSCKFLHDRSDYKHGWQLEREMDEGRYGKNGKKSGWSTIDIICVYDIKTSS